MGRKRITTPDGETLPVLGEMQVVYSFIDREGGHRSYIDLDYAKAVRRKIGGGKIGKFVGWRLDVEVK